MRRGDDLNPLLCTALQVAHQQVLQLRMKMGFWLFDEEHVERRVRFLSEAG